jgi:hypothetical protein
VAADAVRLDHDLVAREAAEELGELAVGVGSRGLEEEVERDLASFVHSEAL